MKFDSKNFKAFRNDFFEAVKDLEKKYGVKISMGNISYDEFSFTTKLTVVNGASEQDAEKAKFNSDVVIYSAYGVTSDDYRKAFKLRDGKTYYLVGFKTRARKNPCIIEDEKGTKYTCSLQALGFDVHLGF